jgi:hypothetical protein
MKRMPLFCLLLTLVAPLGAYAADAAHPAKNACVLDSSNCAPQSASIQDIIASLETELAKGSATYTPAELATLQAKLNDYQQMLTALLSN